MKEQNFEIKDGLTREITNIIMNSMPHVHRDKFLFKCRIKLVAELIEIEKNIRKDFNIDSHWL